ncbi:hypothetical protein D9M70_427270 [compost metagenome]
MREHRLLGARVLVPFVERSNIDRAELPLLERVDLAFAKAAALLFLADREPELEQVDAAAHQVALELRGLLQEVLVLTRGAEAHHVFDAGAVVPGAVEQHDFTGGRQVLHVTLEIPLAAFGFRRLFKCHHTRAARVHVFHEAFDGAALAGGIAAFEQDHHALPALAHPGLELEQLDLQPVFLLFVIAARHQVLVRVGAIAPASREFVVGMALAARLPGTGVALQDEAAQLRGLIWCESVEQRAHGVEHAGALAGAAGENVLHAAGGHLHGSVDGAADFIALGRQGGVGRQYIAACGRAATGSLRRGARVGGRRVAIGHLRSSVQAVR